MAVVLSHETLKSIGSNYRISVKASGNGHLVERKEAGVSFFTKGLRNELLLKNRLENIFGVMVEIDLQMV